MSPGPNANGQLQGSLEGWRGSLLWSVSLVVALLGAAFFAWPDDDASAQTPATVNVTLEVSADGGGNFNAADGPGLDSGATNGVVRTNDTVQYTVNLNAETTTAANTTFELEAPPNTAWTELPPPDRCLVPGSSITGNKLVCRVGDVPITTTYAVPVLLRVMAGAKNGDTIPMTVTARADNAPAATSTPVSTTVSAAGKFDLSKADAGAQTEAVKHPDGRDGVVFKYPLTIQGRPQDPAHPEYPRRLGFEALSSPITFTDDLSTFLDGVRPTTAIPYDWDGNPACGPASPTVPIGAPGPGGTGGGPRAVTNSGTFACTQASPGQDIAVTITGADTTMAHLPTQNQSGEALPADSAYVVSGYLRFWVASEEIDRVAQTKPGGTFTSVNRYTNFDPSTVSGQSNYGSAIEPLPNNQRPIAVQARGLGIDKFYASPTNGGAPGGASGIKTGDGYLTPGELVMVRIPARNLGLMPLPLVVCDKFDNVTQELVRNPSNGQWAGDGGRPGVTIEYAAATWTSPQNQQQSTCEDADGPWFSDPTAVPGGSTAVGKIRWRMTAAPLTDYQLSFRLKVRETATPGTLLRNFASRYADFGPGSRWVHNTADPAKAEGGLADRINVTGVHVRVAKKVVDPGTTAATTRDATQQVSAGRTVTYALYPTLTSFAANPQTADVTVVDTLPVDFEYLGGASIEPTSVVKNADGTTTLTWVLPAKSSNQPIDPITLPVRVSGTARAGSPTNTTTISTPSDTSPATRRTANRVLSIIQPGGLVVEKTAVAVKVIAGDAVAYDLSYRNITGAALPQVELIDVLPYNGDGRTPASDFAGRVELASAPVADAVAYTARTPAQINLDPGHASNQAGGATTWCTAAQFGSAGCPANLAAATAVRLTRTTPLAPDELATTRLTLNTPGAKNGNVYTNRFGARGAGLTLPVTSNDATTAVVAGRVGDYVWIDTNRDGIQDADESVRPDVTVTLTGTDDKGAAVNRTATTDADGKYLFDGLRPGTYQVTFTNPDPSGHEWTQQSAGPDRGVDSNADTTGRTPAFTLTATGIGTPGLAVGDDLTIDGGLRPVLPPTTTTSTTSTTVPNGPTTTTTAPSTTTTTAGPSGSTTTTIPGGSTTSTTRVTTSTTKPTGIVSTTTTQPRRGKGSLPKTGRGVGALAAVAAILLATGAGLVALQPRRRTRT